MVELLLLRHAKSRRDVPGLADHDRDLAPRGERDAPRVGRLIADHGLVPDLVLCSTATRARRTWDLAATALDRAPEVVLLRELYLAAASRMAALVRARGGAARRLLLVAHNPGLHELGVGLAAEGDARVIAALVEKFPTAALARLVWDGSAWDVIGSVPGRLAGFWQPRELP